jgi:hypothetical protein
MVRFVSVAEAGASPPGRRPFSDATPAEIRDALGDQEIAEFDRQWRGAMDRARDRLDLAEVHEVLEAWRRIAWLIADLGATKYRDMIASAEERARTGERPAGSVPWSQLKVELGLPE